MSVYRPTYTDPKTGNRRKSAVWWTEFSKAGKRFRESTNTTRKTLAKEYEKQRRLDLEKVIAGVPLERPEERIKTVAQIMKEYQERYRVNHRERSARWVQDRSVPVVRILGSVLISDLTEARITEYMGQRKREQAGNRTVNMEISILSRAIGKTWGVLWPKVKKLEEPKDIGRALSADEERAILEAATRNRSPVILPFIRIALTTGMRFGEIRNLKWDQIDLEGRTLRVGKAKTAAGTGRGIPMNSSLYETMAAHASWLSQRLGEPLQPHWYVFPWCNTVRPIDPERPVTALKTAWNSVRAETGVNCRFHDLRHTACTKMAEAGVPEGTMKALMGHMSAAMIERYSHIREQAKRAAVEALNLPSGTFSVGVPKDSPKVKGEAVIQ